MKKCSAMTKAGRECQAKVVTDSEPPLCHHHGGSERFENKYRSYLAIASAHQANGVQWTLGEILRPRDDGKRWSLHVGTPEKSIVIELGPEDVDNLAFLVLIAMEKAHPEGNWVLRDVSTKEAL